MTRRTTLAARLAAAAVLLAAAGCSLIDPHNMIGRQMGEAHGPATEPVPSPPPATLDAGARERAFDFVWDTINDHYYDPRYNGVDWKAVRERYHPLALAATDDDAFWDVLDRMTGELKDAHTRVESPRRVELRQRDESITLGLAIALLDGRLTVSGVNADSDAWWAGVRPGMFIVTLGGAPAMQAYRMALHETRNDSTDRSRHLRAVRRIMTGAPGSKAEIEFERADGTRFTATLVRHPHRSPANERHRVLPS
ncbi:MAG TPA: hypothetical protein VH301_15930, partial [Usitatibacter sp.]|nr:hypothetical protein [Usitatibacter sp.]